MKIELSEFFDGEYLDLQKLRDVCNLLTDDDYTLHGSFDLPSRKKAFKRNVRHINEKLEQAYRMRKKIDDEILYQLYVLSFYRSSFLQKAEVDANPDVSLAAKVKMGMQTSKSRRSLRVEIPEQEKYGQPSRAICDTIFWRSTRNLKKPEKRFEKLAKEKKIKIKKSHVVLFDKFSESGSTPKISTNDVRNDVKWTLKWGDEIHADPVASHIFASLGYDVDHPYFFGKGKITLLFDPHGEVRNSSDLIAGLKKIFKIDISDFILEEGTVTAEMGASDKKYLGYEGFIFLRFKKCALEARPDRVKRLGSFIPEALDNQYRTELRGSILAHQFIDNWDTREENTLLTQVHQGNYVYYTSAVFSDLGTSMGVDRNTLPIDFKVGLVNKLAWEAVIVKNGKIHLCTKINSILDPYDNADYYDLKWCAEKIAAIDSSALRYMIKQGHWPKPIRELYFHKMASRRASIIKAFDITDPHPIAFDRSLTIEEDGVKVIENGKLIIDYRRDMNPESFISKKGRNRNYGN